MAPIKWANKVKLAKEVGLSMLLKIINFLKKRRNHVSQKEVVEISLADVMSLVNWLRSS